MDLFRPEVFKARDDGWMGSVHLATFKMGWPIAILSSLLALFIICFLSFGHYTRSEHVAGQLVPSDGLILVSSPGSGVITEMHIQEGTAVEHGDILLEVSLDKDNIVLGEIGATIAQELEQHRWRLNSQLDTLPDLQRRREAEIQQRLAYLNRQLELAQSELELRHLHWTSAREMQERIAPLSKNGQLTAIQLQQYQVNVFESEAAWRLAQSRELDRLQEIESLRVELEQLPREISETKNTIEQSLSELYQANARNEAQRSLIVRAPRAGVISGLSVTGGHSVADGQRLASIVPADSLLIAELWVPASAIGLIESGGRVTMRYHAFPSQRFGHQHGHISQIARHALSQDEIRSRTGLEIDTMAYRVLVQPDYQFVSVDGHPKELISHMTLDAALLLERRRLFELSGLSNRPIVQNQQSPASHLSVQ